MKRKTVVAQHDGTVVALVAQGVGGRTFGLVIRQLEIALQQWLEFRSVRSLCAAATRAGPGVAVMAVGAIHHAVHRPGGRNQTRHARGIFPGGFDRMKTLIARAELQARIRKRKLAHNGRLTPIPAVGVAAKTDFIFLLRWLNNAARRRDAGDASQRAGNVRRNGNCFVRRVRIMAIGAGHMAFRGINWVFVRTVGIAVERDWMDADFLKIGGDIFLQHGATVVTGEAVLLSHAGLHQKFPPAGGVIDMADFTTNRRQRGRPCHRIFRDG